MNSNMDVAIVLRNQTWMLKHPVGKDAMVIVRSRTWMLLSCWPGCSDHRMQLNMDATCLLIILRSRTWMSCGHGY